MGAFGLQFTKIKTSRGPQKPVEPQTSPKFVSHEPEADTPLQKTIAYSSYYTMVFATICAVSPVRVAEAAELLGVLVP
ncbi:MAG: hypothetical protein AAFN43_06115 [Pseudomonadota bacterium]